MWTINWKESDQWRPRCKERQSYTGILETNRNTAGNLEQNRNEGGNKGCLGVGFKLNETYVTNNRLQRRRLKIEKSNIVCSCELGDFNNMSVTSEIARDYKIDIDLSSIWPELLQDDKDFNSKLATFSPMFMKDSSGIMHYSDFHGSEVKVDIFNTQKRDFLVLQNLMGKDDPLQSQGKNIIVKVTSEG